MTELTEKFRIKNKTIEEVAETLFSLKCFPKSFSQTFEIKELKLPSSLDVGSKVALTLQKFGVSAACEYEVTELADLKLVYRQSCGLMKKWEHSMTLSEGKGSVELVDTIIYEVPYGLLGHLANDLYLRTEVPAMLYSRLKTLKLK